MKPKFPLSPGAAELPSPADGGARELQWEQPKLLCPLQSREAALALQQPRWEVFFSFDIAANEETRAVWSPGHAPLPTEFGWGEGAVKSQLLMGI